MDTIYALASATGKAGVAVVRISGPLAHACLSHFGVERPALRKAALRRLVVDDVLVDEALVLCFPEGASFTGEAVTELHLHGSVATIRATLAALSKIAGLRLAEPGEFTRRALENGCLDLAQVEGLADLIDAETEAQRRQALKVLSGALGEKAERWRTDLIRAAALLEATIDFADEEVPVDVSPEVLELIDRVSDELKAESKGSYISERIREGFEVAIVGPPNAGKSTLLNALAGREAAITSEFAGTTRDVIEVRMDLNGLAVTFLDTAGLRETEDHVEGIGIERAIERAKHADLRVFLSADEGGFRGLKPEEDDIQVSGKSDISGKPGVSGKTGDGVSMLVHNISSILSERAQGAVTATHERHRVAIDQGIEALESARLEVLRGEERAELAAEELRSVVRALDSIVGRVDVEHLLDEIFASFCLGK
ncbi:MULTISPECIES: tRNA uridine-5-carboxymethylaminomethyl(34) synthesis GTPase MnmE [Halocynthiibacter]|uniref:tRNA modification GTPase MnmE n=1 Tax=Halocynthiibacter halioticoli TaxID=2986804 RepID=A0AAE3LTR3_9RHOB|nr:MULTISPECIES: tRNA uridine-5-carboxymethylaminomethyl(34) synthesis GTPase MnmE [Halocynthiibacter]MCV6825611.1 tRNA uridine-5-carboxymethylaminomethyl(34) synthesis GTPase MnmE [Halocynthiibacter halioticoli]MCW4058612.1 tRNA uridine-5-carboxymethylaminomethyl(34) synthesis GTPase MnmE [Halocynthiibacter sp. SDUM655004]